MAHVEGTQPQLRFKLLQTLLKRQTQHAARSLRVWKPFAVKYLVISLTAIVLYLAGLTMSLFGPTAGRFAGVIAFLLTIGVMAALDNRYKDGTWEGFVQQNPKLLRLQRSVHICMILCVVLFVSATIAMRVSAGDGGVADGDRPVFAHQTEYTLNNHGDTTRVTRTRYLIAGSSFLIGWHSFGLLFALFALHLVLYGKFPKCMEDEPATEAEALTDHA